MFYNFTASSCFLEWVQNTKSFLTKKTRNSKVFWHVIIHISKPNVFWIFPTEHNTLKNHTSIPVIKIPTQGSSALRWYTVLLGYPFLMFLQMVSSSSSSWTSWILKMTAPWSFKHWDTLTHLTQQHILQDLNPYHHHCESIRPSSGCLLAQVNHNNRTMFSSVWLGHTQNCSNTDQ
jgi:hypothetical protein